MYPVKLCVIFMIVISLEKSLVQSRSDQKEIPSIGEDKEAKLIFLFDYSPPCHNQSQAKDASVQDQINTKEQSTSNYEITNTLKPSVGHKVNDGSLHDLLEKDGKNRPATTPRYDEDDEEFEKYKPPIVYSVPNPAAASAEKVSREIFDLSQKLVAKVLDQSQNKFEIISPVSISAALQLAYLGSNRETFNELFRVLGYDSGEYL